MKTVCDHLIFDHKRCDELFARTETCVMLGDWAAASACFQDFLEAFRRHVRTEEQVLLPAFQQSMKGADAAIALLRSEHRHILAMLERMSDTVNRHDKVEFLLHAETFTMLKKQHGMKEEEMLYPLLDKLPSNMRNEIIRAMREHLCLYEEAAAI
jgi:hemerythrin-like domain-containing protein